MPGPTKVARRHSIDHEEDSPSINLLVIQQQTFLFMIVAKALEEILEAIRNCHERERKWQEECRQDDLRDEIRRSEEKKQEMRLAIQKAESARLERK